MKNIILLIYLLFSTRFTFAQDVVDVSNPDEKIVNRNKATKSKKSFSETLLLDIAKNKFAVQLLMSNLIERRCELYTPSSPLTSVIDIINPFDNNCEKASKDLFKVLDFDLIANDNSRSTSKIIFKSTLITLLKSGNFGLHLRYLEKQLQTAYVDSETIFNLYEYFNKLFNYNKKMVLTAIAALFQDGHSLAHIDYLEKFVFPENKNNKEFVQNLFALKRMNLNLQLILNDFKYSNKIFPNILLFPDSSISGMLGKQPALYHFYVPAAIAIQLLEYQNNNMTSFITPFLMTYLYEQFYKPDLALTDWKSYMDIWGLTEPNIPTLYKAADLYYAYEGALLGASNVQKPIKWEFFVKNSRTNMDKTFRIMLKSL